MINPTEIGAGTEEEELYRENILDHFRHPHNFGAMEATITHREFNPLCGDDIQLFLRIDQDKITDAHFAGSGCAISVASASMLTDKIKGMTLDQAKQLRREEVLEMLGVDLGVVRMKCGLLSLKVLLKGLGENHE